MNRSNDRRSTRIHRHSPRILGFRRSWPVVLLLLATASGPSASGADGTWTVETLNDHQPWDQLASSRLAIRVEGRLGTHGRGQFRLQKCDARFTIDNERLRQIGSKANVNVEVKGQFKKNNGRLEFAVDELKALPGYVDQFDLRSVKLTLPTINDWTELGDWAAERAKFYDDAELMKKAKSAYASAIELEYKSLKPTDAEGRFTLAQKMASLELSDNRRLELVHEGFRIQWKALQKAEPADAAAWRQFTDQLQQQLPGATTILKSVDARSKEDYEHDPDTTYRKANGQVRQQLHRFFLMSVIRKQVTQAAATDGHDGDAIADQIARLIPEETALAETYRLAKLGFRVTHVATATREEAENLAEAFRARGKMETAQQALVDWIKAHEARLKADGAIGLLQLADEHLSLLGNRVSAAELLMEANRIDPALDGAKTRLAALGYQFRNGRWVKSTASLPETDPVAVQSPTGISLGMSAADLRKLLGQPRSLARAITARGMTEIWSFGPAGSTQLVVRLEQTVRDSDPKVTSFSGQ